MEIALVVFLFLIGTVGGAIQAMKYLERRNRPRGDAKGPSRPEPRRGPD